MRQTVEIQKVKLLILFSLKGFSQVMLMENRISGSLILLGISLYSPYLGLMAFLSSIVGTSIGLLKDREIAMKGFMDLTQF